MGSRDSRRDDASRGWSSAGQAVTPASRLTDSDFVIHHIRAHEYELRSVGVKHVIVYYAHGSSVEPSVSAPLAFACQMTKWTRDIDVTGYNEILGTIVGFNKAISRLQVIRGPLEQIQGGAFIDAF